MSLLFSEEEFIEEGSNDKTSKTWVATINNYTDAEIKVLDTMEANYVIYGKEVGEQNGTPHLQCYFIMKRAYRLSQLKKIFPRARFAIAKAKDAMNYCMKEGDFTVRDNRTQGRRNDIADFIKDMEDSGGITRNVVASHKEAFVKYYRGFRELETELFLTAPERTPPRVYWLYGETGTGKTRYVYDQDPGLWCSTGDLKWFNGYKGQYTVLIDDFRPDFCPFPYLLRLLDRYPIQVQTKGGFTWWKPVEIYITAPYSPQQMYVSHPEDLEQLTRRITGGIHHVTGYEEINIPLPI